MSADEWKPVLDVFLGESFADKAPDETDTKLRDQGTSLCSVRTMYRVLEANQEVRERRHQLRHPAYAKPQRVATAPYSAWTSDITMLLGLAKWTYYYPYVILEIYSRYVVGWMLAQRESQHLAERLIRETLVKECIHRDQLTIDSDRGAAMRSHAVTQLMATLGVIKSVSRPHVRDDNPFSESPFKALKYRHDFPDRFARYDHGLDFCRGFFRWHNAEHRHGGIGLLTPALMHTGQATAVLEAGASVLAAAHARHPERFVRGVSWPLTSAEEVGINPPENRPTGRTPERPRDTTIVPQVS